MNAPSDFMLFVSLAYIGACIFSFTMLALRDDENAALRDRAKRQLRQQPKQQKARGGEPVLVEVAIPLECIGVVRCDFYGIHHVQVFGEEVVTDEETYRRVVKARDEHVKGVEL